MAAVAPLVVPGVTMAELAEAVEHELRLAGSRCPSFATLIFTGLGEDDFDSETATARRPIPEGTSVMFDFGGVVDGYCSDFGRTIYCGEPPHDYLEAYEVMLAAQEAGRAAATPRHARARGQRRLPRADRGGRASASTSATAWATGSGSTFTSGRSCRPRTRRRSRPG